MKCISVLVYRSRILDLSKYSGWLCFLDTVETLSSFYTIKYVRQSWHLVFLVVSFQGQPKSNGMVTFVRNAVFTVSLMDVVLSVCSGLCQDPTYNSLALVRPVVVLYLVL